MENIIADYKSSDPTIGGYNNVRNNWPGDVTNPAPPSGLSGSVSISLEDSLNNVKYVVVNVRVIAAGITNIDLQTWLIR